MRFVASLVVVAGIAGACALPDREEFARGTATAEPDGGDGGGRALDDAGPSDGGTAKDATTDSPAGFCPRRNVYCNDFSSGEASLGQRVAVSKDVGSLTLENGTLVSRLDALPNPGQFEAQAQYVLPEGSLAAVIEIDVNVSPASWNGGNMIIMGFYYAGQANDHAYELYIDGNISSITTTENGQLLYDNATRDLPRGAWVHVKLEVDFTPHNGSFRVSYDGMPAISHSGPIDFLPTETPSFVLSVGMTRNNAPTPALTVAYDNLALSLP